MANVRSLANKLDDIRLLRTTFRSVRDCCAFVFVETWLNDTLVEGAYRPRVKVTKPTKKRIRVWPEGSSVALQDCFSTTDWNMFKEAATINNTVDLQEYTETVTAYIRKCIDDLNDFFARFEAVNKIPAQKLPLTPEDQTSPTCHNDYRPVALTPVIMKCFERLVMHHIKTSLPPALDPYQFAYRSNRSTDDAISTALHSVLTHLETRDSCARMLFLDFSSAFNTIIPQQLILKLVQLGLDPPLCNWLLDFLTGRPQFADDTTVVGLIRNDDESNYRSEVSRLVQWCDDNYLRLNVEKTKEMVVDFRRRPVLHPPLLIAGAAVEQVTSTKFLGVHISQDLTWNTNTTALAKKAQQRLYFLRKLKRAGVPSPIMCTFYRGTIESVLTSCITVWFVSCTIACRKTLQRVVKTAEKIIGVPLLSLLDMHVIFMLCL
ncbi:uncharacterized protein ACB058_012558 [Synchiropus picturatus]